MQQRECNLNQHLIILFTVKERRSREFHDVLYWDIVSFSHVWTAGTQSDIGKPRGKDLLFVNKWRCQPGPTGLKEHVCSPDTCYSKAVCSIFPESSSVITIVTDVPRVCDDIHSATTRPQTFSFSSHESLTMSLRTAHLVSSHRLWTVPTKKTRHWSSPQPSRQNRPQPGEPPAHPPTNDEATVKQLKVGRESKTRTRDVWETPRQSHDSSPGVWTNELNRFENKSQPQVQHDWCPVTITEDQVRKDQCRLHPEKVMGSGGIHPQVVRSCTSVPH